MPADRPPPDRHVVADQSEVFAFLADPATHGLTEPVKRIDTHGAAVFLAGPNVYKVKRAVLFDFMDFSTLEKRHAACEAELAVNHPNAPTVYLGVVPIVRGKDGLGIGGAGEVIEWAVHLRRFDESATLDRVAGEGGLTPAVVSGVVDAVLAAHDRARVCSNNELMVDTIAENDQALREYPEFFPPGRVEALTTRSSRALERVRPLLLQRSRAGWVRRCHGDLHLRNIALVDGRPTLFDALEFNDELATGDVLYDLAFLLMDLWERGHRQAASSVLNRYLWFGDPAHIDGLAALPLFLSLRAAIRAHVGAAAMPFQKDDPEPARRQARIYFELAEQCLDRDRPMLVAIGGLSGTGKTTLAAGLAPDLNGPVGAVHLRSDIERKRLAGVGETDRLAEHHYRTEVTEAVYDRLRDFAGRALKAGQSVIVDAVHQRPDERTAIADIAAAAGAPFIGLWLEAPVSTLTDRVNRRVGDASDADAAVVAAQAERDAGPIEWHRIAAGGDGSASLAAALQAIGQ